ncbi:hypothetical protein ES702_03655 [subsurface metagenome]
MPWTAATGSSEHPHVAVVAYHRAHPINGLLDLVHVGWLA